MPTDYDICFITVGDKKTAEALTKGLLKERLAACVSVIGGVESSYWWKGRLEKSAEMLLLVKSRRTLREDIIQFVKKNHPYSVPETVFARIDAGSRHYLDWLGANTAFTTNIPVDKLPGGNKPL